jgi:hypothetical protein
VGKRLSRKRARAAKRERGRIIAKGGHDRLAVKRDALVVPSCALVFPSRKQFKKHRKVVPSCAVPTEREVEKLKSKQHEFSAAAAPAVVITNSPMVPPVTVTSGACSPRLTASSNANDSDPTTSVDGNSVSEEYSRFHAAVDMRRTRPLCEECRLRSAGLRRDLYPKCYQHGVDRFSFEWYDECALMLNEDGDCAREIFSAT